MCVCLAHIYFIWGNMIRSFKPAAFPAGLVAAGGLVVRAHIVYGHIHTMASKYKSSTPDNNPTALDCWINFFLQAHSDYVVCACAKIRAVAVALLRQSSRHTYVHFVFACISISPKPFHPKNPLQNPKRIASQQPK